MITSRIGAPTAILALSLSLATSIALADTAKEHIAEAERLNEKCRNGASDSPATISACRERDAKVRDLRAHGWCYGHDPQPQSARGWESCAADSKPIHVERHVFPGAGDWFFSFREQALAEQFQRCERFEVAKNHEIARACRDELLNAADYLTAHAKRSVLPQDGWLLCSHELNYEWSLAARCIAAVEDVCAVTDDGKLKEMGSCFDMIDSGAYAANPAALRLDFSRSRPRQRD